MSDAAFLFSGWEPIVRIVLVGTGAYIALVLLLRDAMLRERVTEDELRAVAGQQGAGSWDSVEAIVLEANGNFAVVEKSSAGDESTLSDVIGPPSQRKEEGR